jgi:hypothetical protein
LAGSDGVFVHNHWLPIGLGGVPGNARQERAGEHGKAGFVFCWGGVQLCDGGDGNTAEAWKVREDSIFDFRFFN